MNLLFVECMKWAESVGQTMKQTGFSKVVHKKGFKSVTLRLERKVLPIPLTLTSKREMPGSVSRGSIFATHSEHSSNYKRLPLASETVTDVSFGLS
jgi:hypothetical protein